MNAAVSDLSCLLLRTPFHFYYGRDEHVRPGSHHYTLSSHTTNRINMYHSHILNVLLRHHLLSILIPFCISLKFATHAARSVSGVGYGGNRGRQKQDENKERKGDDTKIRHGKDAYDSFLTVVALLSCLFSSFLCISLQSHFHRVPLFSLWCANVEQ